MKKEYKKRLISWAIIIILAVIAFFYYKESVTKIIDGIKELNKVKILISCLIAVISFLAEGYIIYVLARPINSAYRWRDGFKVSYFCEFFRMLTLGGGAGVAEIYYLQKKNIPVGKGAGVAFMQYGSKKIGILLCGLIGSVAMYIEGSSFEKISDRIVLMGFGAFFTAFVAFLVIGLAFSKKINQLCKAILEKLDRKFTKFHKYFEKWNTEIELLYDAGQTIFHQPVIFAQIVGACLIKFFAIYAIPAYILIDKCNISVFMCVMLMAVVGMIDIVIPIPSGVGSFEFLSVTMFKGIADPLDTLTAILVFRFATWIVPFGVGMILWIIDNIKNAARK